MNKNDLRYILTDLVNVYLKQNPYYSGYDEIDDADILEYFHNSSEFYEVRVILQKSQVLSLNTFTFSNTSLERRIQLNRINKIQKVLE